MSVTRARCALPHLLLLGVCAGLWATAVPSEGQERNRLGMGRMPLGGPAAPPLIDGDTAHAEKSELTAARLLASARQDIVEGRPDVAQRMLELLIARFPDTAVMPDARRELYQLYAASQRIGAARPAHASGQGNSQASQGDSRGNSQGGRTPLATATRAPATGPAEQPASGWQTSVTAYRRLQEELRNGIGDRIFFSAGSTELGSRARAVIAAQAEWLQRRPDVVVLVEGHADDAMVGADDDRLAEARAAVVRDRMVADGVDPARIRLEAHGARDQVAPCGDADCAAQNRRALIQVELRRSQLREDSATASGPGGPARDSRR